MKIEKYEYFFVFDDGERESMWEITRKPGKNFLSHEVDAINQHNYAKRQNIEYPFVMVATYSDGTKEEI